MSPDALAHLHAAAFTQQRPWSAQEFTSLLESPHAFLETLTHGFVLGRVVAGEAELLTVAVAPDAQRRGIGRRLLTLFDEVAKKRDASMGFLEVAADNHAAIALYEQTGWHRTAERPGYYKRDRGVCVDAMLMEKPFT